MCCNFPRIKITEGNAFTLIFPLKRRSYLSEKPIDDDIDVTRLTDVRVTLGGVEYAPTIETYGVRIDVPAKLVRGTYDGLLTADYDGNAIRGAYESCVQIVAWNAQSNAQQYILGSPVATNAAYVLGYMPTDAEVEALKQQLREQIAAAEQAEAEAIAEKEKYAEALEHLDDIAKETSVEGIAGSIGTPTIGQPSTLFAAIAAGGGGGGGGGTGDAREETSQDILAAVQSGNVTAIAELLNNTHGLDALRAIIAEIPTTAPATPQNVTDAKDAVIAALPSVSGLATEANATVNKQAVLDAIAAAETALQGGDQTATLTALKQAVAAIVIPTDYAKETTAQQAAADAAAAKVAAEAITGYALQGYDTTATNTTIAALIGYTIQDIDGV